MDKWWEKYMVDVPDGQSGNWRVDKFSVNKDEAKHYNAMSSFNFSTRGTFIQPGTYTRLMRKEKTIMSDTPSEVRDHLEMIGKAEGNVLVAGLGLGMVAQACLEKDSVDKVTVIELSPDVINLVGSHLYNKHGSERLEIVQGDIFTWKWPRGVKYDAAWFDIWDDVCGDNALEMSKLKRQFAKRSVWRGCWREWETRNANRRGRW